MGKIETIISSLAELNTQASINKLKDYAKEIQQKIIKQNNDQRLRSLELLERFAFRVPKEALGIVGIFINEKMEKEVTKYRKPFMRSGRKHSAVLEKCLDILEQYNLRYGLFDECLTILIKFYQFKVEDNEYEDIRKKAREIIIKTADYNLKVIQPQGYGFLGYKFQELFIEKIKSLITNKDDRIFYLSLSIAEQLLKTELEGTYWDYKAVTIKFGPAKYTPGLRKLREKIIRLFFRILRIEKSEERKLSLVDTLASSMRFPIRGKYSDQLEQMIMDDIDRIINFYMQLDFYKTNPAVLQEIEEQVAFQRRRFTGYKGNNKKLASKIARKSLRLLNKLRNDNFYKIYRILVGDELYLRDSDEDDWRTIRQEKEAEIGRMVNNISLNNLSKWIQIFQKIDKMRSLKDEYKFADFKNLSTRLGKGKPEIADKVINILLKKKFVLKSFLTYLILGMRQSRKSYLGEKWIRKWLKSKDFDLIKEIPYACWPIEEQFSNINDVKIFKKLVDLKLSNEKRQELDCRILIMLSYIYKQDPKLSNNLFLAILQRLPETKLSYFTNAMMMANYRNEIIVNKLPERIFKTAMRRLLKKDRIEHHDEEFIAIYAKKLPLELIDFFKRRIDISRKIKKDAFSITKYDALPYHLGEITKTFSGHPAYRKVIRKILSEWIMKGDWLLQFEGCQFLHELSSNLDRILRDELILLIKSKSKKKIIAVLRVLKEYQGSPVIDELCKEAIKVSRKDKDVRSAIAAAIYSTGVVTGEYGIANAYQNRLDRLKEWSKDKNKYVKQFAGEFSKSLRKDIARERKRVAEQEMRLKKGVDL
ncbi:MAG: hypothetical protein ISS47_02530 [Candidatus Omnitrophica bacterium]|nr:hypothetical protein [Candidatus Omnitrophota bacterium]